MSVINQMLKDLEQRAPEQGHASIPTVAPQKASTLKIVLLSALVLLSLNALGFYIWSLQERVAQSESKQLTTVNTENVKQLLTSQPIQVKKQSNQELSNQEQPQELASTSKVARLSESQPAATQKPNNQEQLQNVVVSNNVEQNPLQQSKEESKPDVHSLRKEQSPDPVITDVSANQLSSIGLLTREKSKTSKMSVSRRQLTSKELVSQKLTRAEKAVNNNEATKAEQLFEEILIIDPDHKEARKKLAALWFGRKSYQQAVNILSQGISIDKQDGELRLMKARIHLKQGQHEAAYNTLKPLSYIEQEEYQVMLANIAQQIEQYKGAIAAYQVLIKMQPYSGRWHLGLGIVYDKNSQFSLAVNEYAIALTKTDLSASSAKFAEQRMQALGE